MAKYRKLPPTSELLHEIIVRIPEGFIHKRTLKKRVRLFGDALKQYDKAVKVDELDICDDYLFDPERLTSKQVKNLSKWCNPILPRFTKHNTLRDQPVAIQIQEREKQIADSGEPIAQAIFAKLAETSGYIQTDALWETDEEHDVLQKLIGGNILREIHDLVYDPLRLGKKSLDAIVRERQLIPKRATLHEYFEKQAGYTAARTTLFDTFGRDFVTEVINSGGFSVYNIPTPNESKPSIWVRPKDADATKAREVALEAVKIADDEWQEALDFCGDVLRINAKEDETRKSKTLARSYTQNQAIKRLGINKETLHQATLRNIIPAFTDPQDKLRIPAYAVESAIEDKKYYDSIVGLEIVRLRDIAIVCNVNHSTIQRRLKKINLDNATLTWFNIKGRWGLPNDLRVFKQLAIENAEAWKIEQERKREEKRIRRQQAIEAELKRREELRQRLVNAFPTWQHDKRGHQQIELHIGPPNSGKTHDALQKLSQAGHGWYLAPLRLLAFEIFDRLNRDGVLCSLLTGEERIDIPGATVTAATIEMFNANDSGDVVIIDEAQMLADSDRGWAWTQALMQARAEEIHVIGPQTVQALVEQMAGASAVPVLVSEHKRLTPIKVADHHWELDELPAHTILVAFSRRMVLDLKTQLEEFGRKVSVIYGALPPEVRRKQADRFANGETEICVATDAVGMGLNLPADYVCFYEIEKFDGQNIRLLTTDEVKQIGGRAGRYGLSQAGEIGATQESDLEIIRDLYHADPTPIEFARVAPSVQDLELLPGSLAEKLQQWASLQSIPENLKDIVKTGNIEERVQLASMLSDEDVIQLGLDAAVKLTNAPTRKSSRQYWYQCTQAILAGVPQPLPPDAPDQVANSRDLEQIETSITCADVYLWLASRKEFSAFAPDQVHLREMRKYWSQKIDDALLNQIDTARRCPSCGKSMNLRHRFRLCDDCFSRDRRRRNNYRRRR